VLGWSSLLCVVSVGTTGSPEAHPVRPISVYARTGASAILRLFSFRRFSTQREATAVSRRRETFAARRRRGYRRCVRGTHSNRRVPDAGPHCQNRPPENRSRVRNQHAVSQPNRARTGGRVFGVWPPFARGQTWRAVPIKQREVILDQASPSARIPLSLHRSARFTFARPIRVATTFVDRQRRTESDQISLTQTDGAFLNASSLLARFHQRRPRWSLGDQAFRSFAQSELLNILQQAYAGLRISVDQVGFAIAGTHSFFSCVRGRGETTSDQLVCLDSENARFIHRITVNQVAFFDEQSKQHGLRPESKGLS